MALSIDNKPTYPIAPVARRKPAAPSDTSQPVPATETYVSGTSALQQDVLELRRYASGRAGTKNSNSIRPWQHSVSPAGQSIYSNTGADLDPAFHPRVTYRTKTHHQRQESKPQGVRNSNTNLNSHSSHSPAPRLSNSVAVPKPSHQQVRESYNTPIAKAPSQPPAPPRSKEVQLDLVDKVYEKTANARMEMGNNEKICLWYAKDIYNELMDQKEAGKLPDFQPRIYGWEHPPDAQFGEAGARLGKTEAKNYAHNLAVLEDKDGNIVKVLDPWQTGPLWTDSLTTFNSKQDYEEARGDKWWRPGDLGGKLVPWPVEDEQHARRRKV